ncbi:MAG TPA: AAA family ATPase [Candidatus Limnocylindrales bacterium]|nr:AAA family ATPase [Candidatus Limnocylindrales bacterium]
MGQTITSPADLPVEIGRDEPEAYIARDRRWALATHREMPDRVEGAGLFADISGFTPLTEALANELGPERGAEELTANLGRVFHAVIDELDRRGGEVIYFSGDAITCWLDGDDGSRATAAGIAMQEAIGRVGLITTPGGAHVQLALKVTVAVGRARRFVVGDSQIQLIDVLAGALIDDLAEAEHHAEKGEVVLDESALASLEGRVGILDVRHDANGEHTFGVVDRLLVDVPTIDVAEPPPLDEALVTPWILPEVYERLRSARGELLAELRPAYPVFLRFGGIDYDDDPEAIEKLDAFVRRAQAIMAGYGGNVLQLTLGDKGAYLYGVFGSPVAHEDDAARAAAAALELRDLDRTTAVHDIQIGITHGRLRSGTYGHAMRRTFVCLGDAVNLSARLMSKAPPGSIYVEDVVRREAGDAFIWERLPELTVKGKSATITAHALTGSLERASRRKTRYQLDLVGRRDELKQLDDALAAAIAGDGRIIAVSADAGMGKSRLIAEFVRIARRRGLFVAFGECQSFGTNTSYFVWREIWRRLLGIEDGASDAVRGDQLRASIAAVEPELVERAPLLGPLIGVDIADTPLTAPMDAKLRKASLEDLLAILLRARSQEEPVILVLEDCHWIDALSRDLLEVLGRNTARLPVLIVLAYRPATEPGGGVGVERIPDFSEIVLDQLTGDDALELIRLKLEQVAPGAGAGGIPDPFVELLLERSGGNPFYVEELISWITARGVNPADAGALRNLELPDSLHSLVLSRIDSMNDAPRRTLKVASVVGRVFEAPVLPGAYPELGTLDEVLQHLDELRTVDLISLDRDLEHAYLFKHVATQEVAYESLPFGLRARLHGLIGGWIEQSDPEHIDRRLDLLAHHFWLSDDEERKRIYLGRAADASRQAYANDAAIRYLERLIPLVDQRERVTRSIALAEVLHLTGDVPSAIAIVEEVRHAAEAIGDADLLARCDHSLGVSARRVGRFDDAVSLLESAHARFVQAGDRAGAAAVLQDSGTVAAQRGDPALAGQRYRESLQIRQELGDESGAAAVTSNLGIAAAQQGDAAAARAYVDDALAIYTKLGDQRRIANCLVNLAWMDGMAGDHESARRRCEEAIHLALEVGDRSNAGIAQNNLGDALRDLGRLADAGRAYAAAVETYRDLNELGPLMALLEDVAILASRRDDREAAFTLVGASDSLRASLGSPRPATGEATLGEQLAAARESFGSDAADRARRRGSALDVDAAIELAIEVARRD